MNTNVQWHDRRLEAARQASRRALNEWMGIREDATSSDVEYRDPNPAYSKLEAHWERAD